MSTKSKVIWGLIALVVMVMVIGATTYKAFAICEADEKIVIRKLFKWLGPDSESGEKGIFVVQTESTFFTWWGKPTRYQRVTECMWNSIKGEGDGEDETTRIIFNDTGKCNIETFVRYAIPPDEAGIIKMHRKYGGRPENVKRSVKSIMESSLVATATTMSTTDYAVKQRVAFINNTRNQMQNGLYSTEVARREILDPKDPSKTIYKEVTQFAMVEGKPVIVNASALAEVGIKIEQFDVIGDKYDDQTNEKFAERQAHLLDAESKKAERYSLEQDELKVIAEGLMNKATQEAISNVKKIEMVIAAELKAEVAEQLKIEMETAAKMRASVALEDKIAAETKANELLAVATTNHAAALEDKAAMIALAEGKQKAIELSGEMTALEKYAIDAEVEKTTVLASAIPQMQVPNVVISGGGGVGGQGSDETMKNLINMMLLERTGMLDQMKVQGKVMPEPTAATVK